MRKNGEKKIKNGYDKWKTQNKMVSTKPNMLTTLVINDLTDPNKR